MCSSSPAGHAAGLAFPLREGAVSWKGSRYQSCLNSATSVTLRSVKKKKRRGAQGCLGWGLGQGRGSGGEMCVPPPGTSGHFRLPSLEE